MGQIATIINQTNAVRFFENKKRDRITRTVGKGRRNRDSFRDGCDLKSITEFNAQLIFYEFRLNHSNLP